MLIWINGPSSSGKTTLARALQDRLSNDFLVIGLDAFIEMLPKTVQSSRKSMLPILDKLIPVFHGTIMDLHIAKPNIIVDHVFESKDWFSNAHDLFSTTPTVFVGLFCELSELELRELRRGDRVIGLAAWHNEHVHTGKSYDLSISTSDCPVNDCVDLVLNHMNTREPTLGLEA